MNGFWLHQDPEIAAKMNRDSHVVATCREMAIMTHAGLSMHLPESEAPEFMYNVYSDDEERSRSQTNDIAAWAGESRANWTKAFALVKYLDKEFVVRERKKDPTFDHHTSWRKTEPLWEYRDRIPEGPLTPPPMFGPPELRPEEHSWENVVKFYRRYYRADKVTDGSEKGGYSKWSDPRDVPDFIADLVPE